MNQKEKDLLFKDLSARFPYGVKVLEGDVIIETLEKIEKVSETDYIVNRVGDGAEVPGFDISDIKPYLRPVSSMTDEEMDKLFDILQVDKDGEGEDWIKINDVMGIKFFLSAGRWMEEVDEALAYLRSIHIDIYNFIGKKVALEAPEGMY